MSFSRSLNKFLDCGASLSRPVRFDLCPTNPSVTVSFSLRHRWAMRVSRSDGLRCDFSANKLTIWVSAILTLNRMDVDMIFFSFNYSSSLSTSESRAKTLLPDSFDCSSTPSEVSAIPCVVFGKTLRALFLKNQDFFCYGKIFLPYTRRPLGCLLGFWPSGPKPCGGN